MSSGGRREQCCDDVKMNSPTCINAKNPRQLVGSLHRGVLKGAPVVRPDPVEYSKN